PCSTLFPYTTLFRSPSPRRSILPHMQLMSTRMASIRAVRAHLATGVSLCATATWRPPRFRHTLMAYTGDGDFFPSHVCSPLALRSEEHTSELQSPDH